MARLKSISPNSKKRNGQVFLSLSTDTEDESLVTREIKKIRVEAGDLFFASDFLYFKVEKAVIIPWVDIS